MNKQLLYFLLLPVIPTQLPAPQSSKPAYMNVIQECLQELNAISSSSLERKYTINVQKDGFCGHLNIRPASLFTVPQINLDAYIQYSENTDSPTIQIQNLKITTADPEVRNTVTKIVLKKLLFNSPMAAYLGYKAVVTPGLFVVPQALEDIGFQKIDSSNNWLALVK